MRRRIHNCPDNTTYFDILKALEPGDVILLANKGKSPVYLFQRKLPTFTEVSRWFTHVALYVGDGHVVHSNPSTLLDSQASGGVTKDGLEDILTPNQVYAFVRANSIKEVHRQALSTSAIRHIEVPYDYIGCVRAVAMVLAGPALAARIRVGTRLSGKSNGERAAMASGRALVCSDFVFSVYDEVFQHTNPCNTVGGRSHGISTPCEFFDNPNFSCVPM